MKKQILFASMLAIGLMATPVLTSCGDDDPVEIKNNDGETANTPEDSRSAGTAFKCVEQILDGCSDIANEVGESKIGSPLELYNKGKKTEALYAVESWYSFHSREDYSNNIISIRNAYYGTRNGEIAEHSLSKLVASKYPNLDTKMKNAIQAAIDAISDIPNPFRNNINSAQSLVAQTKCKELDETIKDVKGFIERKGSINQNANLDPIISQYVSAVVLPTYKDLKDGNAALYDAVVKFQANPSDDEFENVADAWLAARTPWETSEAFLFGPVDSEGLDPNMDSWPLDQDQIVNILTSGSFDNLNWSDGDDDKTVEAKQGVRGFHTLEFLTFYNGKPRTTHDAAVSSSNADLVYNASNAKSWGNYMKQVAYLLKNDAANLYKYWNESYKGGVSFAEQFKSHNY